MTIRLSDHFDERILQRGRDYARRGLVVEVEAQADGSLTGRVENGQGASYRQRLSLGGGRVEGFCSCPVGYNCKHVAAALLVWGERHDRRGALAMPVLGWLERVKGSAGLAAPPKLQVPSCNGYPDNVKDRLLYVLAPRNGEARIDICKGRINSAGSALNNGIRRYDVVHAIRSAAPAQFIRPEDLELLSALALARLWEAQSHYYSLPDLLRPRAEAAVLLLRRLCETDRFLHQPNPGAKLSWSASCPYPRLGWALTPSGGQKLRFEDADGQPLDLCSLGGAGGATIWIDRERGQIGVLNWAVDRTALRLVEGAPEIAAHETEALAKALPDRLAGLYLPHPRAIRQRRRAANRRFVRLILGAEAAHRGGSSWRSKVQLPTLTLRFVYDGQEVTEDAATEPSIIENGEVVTIARDEAWEAAAAARLMAAGALPIDDLETHVPGEKMLQCDFVFARDDPNPFTLDVSVVRQAGDFAFRIVPALRAEGWEVTETSKWPYRLSSDIATLIVSTEREKGNDAFQGNDWFSLGFNADIAGARTDVAPLIAAFLDQIRDEWEAIPDADALARILADRPVYLDRGNKGYVALDLSPLAPLLHLFLVHHAELGALHPSDARVVRLAEEALAGSAVRFADKAGILPLAHRLEALAAAGSFVPPAGLKAQLRGYQAYGAAWMGTLLEAGFGGVLADDMGLGKTVQTLALLQARREANTPGASLLIAPTSLLHVWRTQAAEFAPELRVAILHGSDRATMRDSALDADLVVTTYPLLSRDRDWLAMQDWGLVILDEAQTLKNPASQMAKTLREIPAKGRLALTGTPLENSLQDLWTLIDWINPGLLGDRKRFQTLFRTPIEKHGDAAAQARLKRRLRPFLLRRTKEEVAAELPPRTEILERVELSKSQQALYESVRSRMDARVREAISSRGMAAARITVLDALLKLRQVCCDPALVKTAAARSVVESAKRERLASLLGELVAEGRRVLVFSQFVEMLQLIKTDLDAAGILSLSLTGQTRKRSEVLEAFAKGAAPVFLLSLKAGGVGLTLTEADTVILYDPWWNPAVERQAMDRTHRIGQTKPVFVHRLVAAGTVEEKILNMQARKQALADALFDETGPAADVLLDEAILRDLFAPLTA